jgi:hypothetical protein
VRLPSYSSQEEKYLSEPLVYGEEDGVESTDSHVAAISNII